MGYYTRFRLNVSGSDSALARIDYNDIVGEYGLSLKDLVDDNTDSIKWYEHESDMKEFSNKYPNVLFELWGKGEESGDIWVAWFRNGRGFKQKAVITFPKPDNLDQLLPLNDEEELRLKEERKKELLESLKTIQEQLDSLR